MTCNMQHIARRVEMYPIPVPTDYNNVCSYINGGYQTVEDQREINEFTDWLNKKYDLDGTVPWYFVHPTAFPNKTTKQLLKQLADDNLKFSREFDGERKKCQRK